MNRSGPPRQDFGDLPGDGWEVFDPASLLGDYLVDKAGVHCHLGRGFCGDAEIGADLCVMFKRFAECGIKPLRTGRPLLGVCSDPWGFDDGRYCREQSVLIEIGEIAERPEHEIEVRSLIRLELLDVCP